MLKPENVSKELHLIYKHFQSLTEKQQKQFESLWDIYCHWNEKINLISRKDFIHLYKHHVLHSLTIAWKTSFFDNHLIVDLGTGGGFPGIPLAICFPETNFLLIDSIKKKIVAVENIVMNLGLTNVEVICSRVENLSMNVHMVVARAVSSVSNIIRWTKNFRFLSTNMPRYALLKGLDVFQELTNSSYHYQTYALSSFCKDPYFEGKFLLHIF